MKKDLSIIIISVLMLVIAGDVGPEHVSKLMSKSVPSDHFFFQRNYPDNHLDLKAFRSALIEAKEDAKQKNSTVPSLLSWFGEGPGNIGGRINEVLVHPLHHDTIYVGNASGGIFKTVDGGASWTAIFDDHPYLAIGELVFDPQDANIVFAGTGDPNISGYPFYGNGIYKSPDGGDSWIHLGLSEVGIISRIAVHPGNSNIIYVAAMGIPYERDQNRGLYKTINGGSTWEKVLYVDDDAGIIDLLMNPLNPDTLFAASWNRIRNNSESLVYGPDAKIHKTVNGGISWTTLGGGLPVGSYSRIGLSMSAQNNNKIFAVYTNSSYQVEGIYKSSNNGSTWVTLPYNSIFSYAFGGFGWYFGQIRVSPYNENELFLLGVDLYKTSNGGNAWAPAGPNWATYQFHADKHDLVYIDSLTILCATDGGLYKSIDGGNNWTDIESIANCQFYRIAADPHETGFYAGGLQDNGTVYGNEANLNSWQRLNGGDGFQPIFDYNNSNIMYSESQNGALYYTTGSNWQYFGYGINSVDRRSWDTPLIMSAHSSSTLYCGTYQVYKNASAPYGLWSSISSDLTDGINNKFHVITTVAESPLDSTILYAGTSDGNVWRSLNGGGNWTAIYSSLPDRYVTHIIASPNFVNGVFVSHSGYRDGVFIPHIHYSSDYGSNWTDISGDMPQLAVNNMYAMTGFADLMVFVATDGGVYSTDNGGLKWARLGKNMPMVPVYDIDFDLTNQKLIAGTFGRSMMSIHIDSMFTVLADRGITASETQIDVYPNPAGAFIQMNTRRGDKVQIFDMLGRMVQQADVFEDNVSLSVNELKKGQYFIVIRAEDQVRKGKFLKL
jgi:photosystem II stability/assembly factor-like uncharacterized protein